MEESLLISIGYMLLIGFVLSYALYRIYRRLQLSRAKHPSLRGHSRWSRRMARWIRHFQYDGEQFFSCDAAPNAISNKRQRGFKQLSQDLEQQMPNSLGVAQNLVDSISDVQFINRYRVPFPFAHKLTNSMKAGSIVEESDGVQIKDIDGNWRYDLTGSYGVNVFGYDFYKNCIKAGSALVEKLGPVLGSYHPIVQQNIKHIKRISGLDEVSFHMSGTEAVMQGVRLARYHTGKTHLVRLCGAYHGWWDGVQPGVGNQRDTNDVYTLRDLDEKTLTILRTRTDIACVLINPMQAMHPNGNVASDSTLIASDRSFAFDRDAYTKWLHTIREICSQRGIVLIFDEIFTGFRLAYRGAQEYFGIQADMVTYGKTIGGGLPIGVLCGKHHWMKRFREDRPINVNFARGTFNTHPYVMGAMHAFFEHYSRPQTEALYQNVETDWKRRCEKLNTQLIAKAFPLRVCNMHSVVSFYFTKPSRYNWMLQFYLRSCGLELSWIGSGRMIFSLNYSDKDFDQVIDRIIHAAERMQSDGWWWCHPQLSNKLIKRLFLKDMLRARSPLLAKLVPGSLPDIHEAIDTADQPLATPAQNEVHI